LALLGPAKPSFLASKRTAANPGLCGCMWGLCFGFGLYLELAAGLGFYLEPGSRSDPRSVGSIWRQPQLPDNQEHSALPPPRTSASHIARTMLLHLPFCWLLHPAACVTFLCQPPAGPRPITTRDRGTSGTAPPRESPDSALDSLGLNTSPSFQPPRLRVSSRVQRPCRAPRARRRRRGCGGRCGPPGPSGRPWAGRRVRWP